MSPGPGLVDVDPLDPVRGLEPGDGAGQGDGPPRLDAAGRVDGLLADDADPPAHPDPAVADPPDGHPAEVLVRGQVRDEELERVARLVGRGGRDPDEQVEERAQVAPGGRRVGRRRAGPGVRVDDRELDLVVVGAEVDEQLVDRVEDLRRPGVAAIDLVDRDDDRQAAGHRLAQHVAGLGQRALGGVDEQEDAVDQEQAPLDLAAEVGVAGRVDDVEPDAVVVDGRLLGQDRDPLLALEVHRVEDPVDDGLVGPERARLAEHRVDERRLAVVDMGDDRDVPDVVADRAPLGRRGDGHAGTRSGGHGTARVWHIIAEDAVC